MKNGKRIHSVTIKRMADDSPDTSYLGEYSNSPTSTFSIDRAHDLDCPQQTYNKIDVSQLERVNEYLCRQFNEFVAKDNFLTDWYDHGQNLTAERINDLETECECRNGGYWNDRSYRYFNPSGNYVDIRGRALPENTADEVIKYVKQDYERMEDLNNGGWYYIGIRADADYFLDFPNCLIRQTIKSGGLWGIESDSDDAYLESVEKEELAALRSQLKAIGFSSRAISTAFKTIEHKEE